MDAMQGGWTGVEGLALPLVMSRATRFRHTWADQTESGWVVRLQGAESVVTNDVTQLHGVTTLDKDGLEIPPLVLDTSASDAYDSLLGVAMLDDDQDAATALAAHCRTHPSDLRFCRAHALPVGHRAPEPLPGWGGCPADRGGIALAHVATMMNGLMGLELLAHNVSVRRTPGARSDIEDALRWNLIGDEAEFYLSRVSANDTLPIKFCKGLIKDVLDELHFAAHSDFGYKWVPQHGLRLANHARTDLALYVSAFAARTLKAVRITDKPLAVRCLNCGRAFQPRNSSQQFCREPECRRAHAARNRQRERSSGPTKKEL